MSYVSMRARISGYSIVSLDEEEDDEEEDEDDSLEEALDSRLEEDPSELSELIESLETGSLEMEAALEAQDPKSSPARFNKRNVLFFIVSSRCLNEEIIN